MDADINKQVYSIPEIVDILTPVARAHGIDKVYLFGSYARGEATSDSDIDLRIDSGRIKSLFELGSFYVDLEEGLKKSIDIVTSDAMSDKFYNSIKREEVILYEK